SADDLVAFAAEAATLEKDMLLVKDIDMEGIEWTPIEGYAKTVLGNGYAIKNLNAPLFGTTNASFKGLHLQVNMSSNDRLVFGALACKISATNEVAPFVEHCTVSGTININNENAELNNSGANETDLNFGCLVGRADGVNFSNCENKATFNITKITKSTAKATRAIVGGLIGYSTAVKRGDGSFVYTNYKNLVNSGNITYNVGESDKLIGARLGGIAGTIAYSGDSSNNKCTFENLTNKGNISISSSHSTGQANYGGGICPVFYGIVKNCTNYGNLTSSGNVSSIYLTGIIAYVNATAADKHYWTQCYNHGKINVKNATLTGLYVGGIGAQIQNAGINDSHNHGEVYVASDVYFKNVHCGGVTAYHSSPSGNTDKELYMTICSNNAPVKVWASTQTEAGATDNAFYRVGGISGYSNAYIDNVTNNKSGTVSIKGTIKQLYFSPSTRNGCVAGGVAYRTNKDFTNITNYGNVEVDATFKHLDTIDADIFIAGVIGYTTMTGAYQNINNYGNITIGENSNISANRVTIGGTVAFATNGGGGNTGVNHGNISVGGTIQTSAPVTTSSSYNDVLLQYISIGGMRGAGRVLADTHNGEEGNNKVGNITISGSLSSSLIAVGGLVGYGQGRNNLTNYGNISSTTSATFNGSTYIGGIIGDGKMWNEGDADKEMKTLKNYGSFVMNGTYKGSGEFVVGGSAGRFNDTGSEKGGWHNYGGITVEGASTKSIVIGGVCAYISGAKDLLDGLYNHEAGDISVNVQSTQPIYIGGIAMRSTMHIKNATNDGNITIKGKYTLPRIGGVICNPNNYSRENLTNNGDIYIDAQFTAASDACCLGGLSSEFISGGSNLAWKNCHNTGDITFAKTASTTLNLNIGGLGSRLTSSTSARLFINCSNSGDITVLGSTKRPYLGGLFGYIEYASKNASCPKLILQNCNNSGDVTCSTVGISGGLLFIGGIFGRINECWNTYTDANGETVGWSGTIKNTGKLTFDGQITASTKEVYMGGIVARHQKNTKAGDDLSTTATYVNEGDIVYAPVDNVAHTHYIGGIIGHTPTSGVANATVNCDIKAWNTSNTGMILGVARTDAIKATNCVIAGSIDKGYYGDYQDDFGNEKTGWTTDLVPISADTFFKYIYGTAIEADVAEGDGCSFYVAPTPAE
ncbi:MAG: hypothetical protein J6V21_06725, partial [Alistipes sp.]|nr:hypothetical protein [Alistipes sp.]